MSSLRHLDSGRDHGMTTNSMTRDELYRTLKRAVSGSFEVLAELGRGQGERSAYVARELSSGGLVVLELVLEDTELDGTPNYGLYIRRELDASIPALSIQCDQCGASISGWARFCPSCDRDLSGISHTTGGRSAAELFQSGELTGRDRYEFLGEMPRTEGGGAVFFARERSTGRLVALRLEREGSGPGAQYRLNTTQRMAVFPQAATSPTPPQQPKVEWRGGEQRVVAVPAGAAPPPAADPTSPKAGGSGGFCPTCGATYDPGVWFCPRDGSAIRPSVASDGLVGQTIAGKYRVMRKLGAGGMGTVYLAEQFAIGRPCALKIMNPSLRNDPEALGRFAREAAHASRITHPNVAVIFDYGESADGTVYLAMEYADGESLGALMKREGAVAQERASEIICQVLDALAAAHAIGIVHRDLKPDNIILARTPTGKHVVKVVDFGIAKAMQSSESQQLTRTGFVVGTPRYMSPEQITGGAIDGRSDIYSADCILYELLVGAVPFSGPSGEITITRRLTEAPPHPRRVNRSVGKRLDQVVVRAMAREPDRRYRTADEFRAALAAAVRPDFTNTWEKRWAGATRALAGTGRRAAGAATGAAQSALSLMRTLGRGLAAGFARTGALVTSTLTGAAASIARGGRGLSRVARPLRSWKLAAAVAVLAVLGAGTPAVVRWLGSSGAQRGATESPSITPPPAAGNVTAGDVLAEGAGAEPTSSAPPPDTVAAQPARAAAPPAPGARAASPQPIAPPALSTAVPVPPEALSGFRDKLELVAMLAGEESFAEAFEQLRQARSRLAALETEFTGAAALRQLRSEYARALSATTSACERVRNVAVQLGESAPVCR